MRPNQTAPPQPLPDASSPSGIVERPRPSAPGTELDEIGAV
jgi:hypothetical protein